MHFIFIIILISSIVIFSSFDFIKSERGAITERYDYCDTVHDEEHSFDLFMIEYVGEDRFYQWFESLEEHERTRDAFKQHFNITDEELKHILDQKSNARQ